MKKKHLNIHVYGAVQGVFFRASARTHAEVLNIKGCARNESDGSVFIEAEGEEENLNQFVEWCYRGPERARVTKVKVEEGEIKKFSSFEVERGVHS